MGPHGCSGCWAVKRKEKAASAWTKEADTWRSEPPALAPILLVHLGEI